MCEKVTNHQNPISVVSIAYLLFTSDRAIKGDFRHFSVYLNSIHPSYALITCLQKSQKVAEKCEDPPDVTPIKFFLFPLKHIT